MIKKRCADILSSAVEVAKVHGYLHMTRAQVADHAGCSHALVNAYFSTMPQLRRSVVRYAIKYEVLPVIAQALVAKDHHAHKAPEDLRRKALDSLMA